MSERLLVFAPNWLGDAVMALPAIADLRRAQPAARMDVAARPSIAPLVDLMDDVDGAIVLDGRVSAVEAIRDGRYEAALLLPNSFSSAWVARRARIPERWGYRNEGRAILLTRAFSPPARVHQAAYYQHLTSALGFAAGPMVPRLRVSSERRAAGAGLLADRGWDGESPLVAMAPGAAFGGAKRWPAERFAAVAEALAADGVRTVLIGAAPDARAGREVVARLRSSLPVIDLIGATDLSMLAAVLVTCRALVTNDSGAMHMAAALGVSVTAVFGPTNEDGTRPIGTGRMSVLHTDVWCRPCMLRECPLTHRCMTGIGAEAVASDVRISL